MRYQNILTIIALILFLNNVIIYGKNCDKKVKGFTHSMESYSVNSMNNRFGRPRNFVQSSYVSKDFEDPRMVYFFSYTEDGVTYSGNSYYFGNNGTEYFIYKGSCYIYSFNYQLQQSFYEGLSYTGQVKVGKYNLDKYTTIYDTFNYDVYVDTKKCAIVNAATVNNLNVTNVVGGSASIYYDFSDHFDDSMQVPAICFSDDSSSDKRLSSRSLSLISSPDLSNLGIYNIERLN